MGGVGGRCEGCVGSVGRARSAVVGIVVGIVVGGMVVGTVAATWVWRVKETDKALGVTETDVRGRERDVFGFYGGRACEFVAKGEVDPSVEGVRDVVRLEELCVEVDKVLGRGGPGRELYVWHVWVDGGEDGWVCVELWDGFVGRPGKEPGHRVWVLVWLPC